MSSRRTLIVVAALALAAVAGIAAFAWLRGVEERAYGDAQLVEVFTVSHDIAKGTPGDVAIARHIQAARIPVKFRPATALVSLDDIKNKVAVSAISVNSVLVDGMFVDPRVSQVTFSQKIPAGQVAITVAVDQVRGVANLLVPGDRVNILVADGTSYRTMYQNVQVIAIGDSAAPQPGETTPTTRPASGLITFAVPPDAAQRIAFAAQQQGGLYLTLVPPDNQPVELGPVNVGNLFSGERTPYGA